MNSYKTWQMGDSPYCESACRTCLRSPPAPKTIKTAVLLQAKNVLGAGRLLLSKVKQLFPGLLRQGIPNTFAIGTVTHLARYYSIHSMLSCLILLMASCTSIVQKGGEILEGSAFSGIELARYRTAEKDRKERTELRELRFNDGKMLVEIRSNKWPGLTLYGNMPRGNGAFDLLSAKILSSHVNGWNEFSLEIQGGAVFEDERKTGGILRINGVPERLQISSGKIRLKSSRFTENAALGPLRNRRERILALVEWMSEITPDGEEPAFANQKEFEKYWKPRLFPEMVSESKRPDEYKTENVEWRREDSVKWNLSYTESLFPEELRDYRNSGAMLRDWEEALAWIFMEHSWNYITGSFSDIHLKRVK